MSIVLGAPIVGWKLAQTVPKAQAAAGIEAPTVSPLLQGMIVPSETVFPSKRFYKPEVEAEIALELASPIDGPKRKDELIAALAGIRVAIEVADTRYVDKAAMGVPAVIADLNSSSALVVGPLLDVNEMQSLLGQLATVRLGDGSMATVFEGDMRPSPIDVLAFLAGFVSERGHTLPAGTIITTGTHSLPTRSGPGNIAVRFGDAMRLGARLSEPWS